MKRSNRPNATARICLRMKWQLPKQRIRINTRLGSDTLATSFTLPRVVLVPELVPESPSWIDLRFEC